MVKGFSKAIVMGNLTRDPETRSTGSGSSVTSFTVAVNRSYRGPEGDTRDEVSYIDCSAWGKPGETIAKYLHRGSGILLSGRLSQHSWDDKESGAKRSRTEIVVEDFNFVGGRDENSDFGGAPVSAPAPSRSSNKKPAKASQEDVLPDEVDMSAVDDIDLEGVPF